MKLGKLPYREDARTLRMARYVDPTRLPTPPTALDLSAKVSSWPMFANDRLGDCTCAAAGHMIEVWSAKTGKERVVSEQAVVSMYDSITSGQDSGAVELDVLKYWRKTGLDQDRILAFALIDLKNREHIELGLLLFGGVYIGVALPASAQDQVGAVWDVPADGPIGPGAPNSWGGHAVNVVAYDANGLTCVTWGKLQPMTWAFWDAYCDEAWAILPSEFKGGVDGFDFATLQSDLGQVASQ